MNATGLLFDVEDAVLACPARPVPTPVVTGSAGDLTPVAGVALWGPLLDRLGVVAEADRRGLRPIGPGGYTGGECYRALVETLLAGGDFLSDRVLLADPATAALRGANALPSTSTLWRFLAGADLGRVAKAAAVNRVMLRRAWAAGAAPAGDRLTIDPDATRVAVYGPGKEGSAFSRTGQTALSPLGGVCGETGDVLALRARGGAANDGRAMGSFIDECVRAVPAGCRDRYRLWVRVDSAGYQQQVVEAADRHHRLLGHHQGVAQCARRGARAGGRSGHRLGSGARRGDRAGQRGRRDDHGAARAPGAASRAPPAQGRR